MHIPSQRNTGTHIPVVLPLVTSKPEDSMKTCEEDETSEGSVLSCFTATMSDMCRTVTCTMAVKCGVRKRKEDGHGRIIWTQRALTGLAALMATQVTCGHVAVVEW
jgi:hypothetical protein